MSIVINRSLSLKRALALRNLRQRQTRFPPYSFLKPKQVDCLKYSAQGQDLLAILPTGYGKTALLELTTLYFKEVTGKDVKALILSPLNAILDQQEDLLGKTAIRLSEGCCKCSIDSSSNSESSEDDFPSTSVEEGLKSGKFEYLLGHPEDFLNKAILALFTGSKWNKSVQFIIVDEAHCVVQWGPEFRKKYLEIVKLRSVFPQAKVIALTATAGCRMRRDICSLLSLQNPGVVSGSVNRSNIKLTVKFRPSHTGKGRTVEDSYTAIVAPLLKELKQAKSEFPKTVLFTSLRWCGFANELGLKLLSESGRITSCGLAEIAQFHASLGVKRKSDLAHQMQKTEECKLRLLFATEAFGMGVNIPDIRRIVHAGIPSTLESYMQQIGRGGRDNEQTEAILWFNNEDVGKSTVSQEMKDYCRLKTCRRQYICNQFDSILEDCYSKHNCCDICAQDCLCVECAETFVNQLELNDSITVDKHLSGQLENVLLQYFDAVHSHIRSQVEPRLFTGLSDTIALDIALNYKLLTSEDIVEYSYPGIGKEFIPEIFNIISKIES